jgi:hypothetical protein
MFYFRENPINYGWIRDTAILGNLYANIDSD